MNQVTQAVRITKEREFQISGTIDIPTNFKIDKNPKLTIQAAGSSCGHNSGKPRPLAGQKTRQIYSLQKIIKYNAFKR